MSDRHEIEFVHLRGFSELEILFVEPLLENAEIPYYRVEAGMGHYMRLYMAAAPFPVELYVPADRLEEARDLIAFPTEGLDEVEELCELPEERLSKLRFSLSKLMAAAMIGFSATEMPTDQSEVESLGEKAVFYYHTQDTDSRVVWAVEGLLYLMD